MTTNFKRNWKTVNNTLRNTALNSMQYKVELTFVKSQDFDITNFEEKMNKFKSALQGIMIWQVEN